MFISESIKLNFSDSAKTKKVANDLMKSFASTTKSSSTINMQSYRELTSRSEFLVPVYIMWRKKVDAPTLLESASISDKRKKIIRKAISQSDRNGIVYSVENPLSLESFHKFLDFYKSYNQALGYDLFLNEDYIFTHKPENLYFISIYNREEELLGGRLISNLKKKISTDFRAVASTKLIKEGFDTVCEKIFYDLAVATGIQFMGRGKEFNLRGLGNRHIGMLWNKLKYGYQPFILRMVPRVYVDFAFLKEEQFDLAFFVSLENKQGTVKSDDQVINLNFICGENPNWQEIQSVKEKSLYKVNVYDRDFNLINAPTS